MNLPASIRLRVASPPAAVRVHLVTRENSTFRLAISTKSLADRPLCRKLRRAAAGAAAWIGRVVRESGLPEQWRLFVLLVVLSFLAAGFATRALMVGFEDVWTDVALASVRRENQELRLRQEILREQTEDALARLAALETTQAGYLQTS